MARQARIDFPGALHHIIVRGIERRNIFDDRVDKAFFLDRLAAVLAKTETTCYAFSLMSNHIHLLLQTGTVRISKVMQSLLTGYAVNFNKRHRRCGKLYQNRFKSILCEKDEYLLQLVRYIHLNPLRAGLVKDLPMLDTWKWAGHAVIMGTRKASWFNAEDTLGYFGSTIKKARTAYRLFIQEGYSSDVPDDFEGGGLIRSLDGLWHFPKRTRDKKSKTGDERILGSDAFIEEVLAKTEQQESTASRLRREGWDFASVLDRAAEAVGLNKQELLRRSRSNARSRGRALLCKWIVDDLQTPQTSVARELGVSRQAVSVLSEKGRKIEHELGIDLEKSS